MRSSSILDIFRIKDLRSRIFFTFGMLLIFRIGSVIPIPGVDVDVIAASLQNASSSAQSMTRYLDFFTGGAFSKVSVFMLGIMPYITMSIVMQLLVLVFPALKRISEEEGGQKKIQKYTRYGTILVCLIQSFAFLSARIPDDAIRLSRSSFLIIGMLTLVSGTMFLIWIGEQITQRGGIGNGISLIIFAGIVARLPGAIRTLVNSVQSDQTNPIMIILVIFLFISIISLVIYEQKGQRKIPVHYAKRVIGRKMMQAPNTYIPFKINPSGVIPVIFAMALMTFPLSLINSFSHISWVRSIAIFLDPKGISYLITYTILIISFSYFYTQVSLNPIEISKRIREAGGSIPGIRSENMEQYLTKILNRIILPGSLFLAFIAIFPSIIQNLFGFPQELAFLMGGTSLLIMVGVDLEFMTQIEAQMKMHHHDGFGSKLNVKRNL